MPVRGRIPFQPSVPGVPPQVNRHGHGGFHSGHAGFGFNFGLGRYPYGVHPQNRCFSDAFFDPFYCTRRPTGFGSFGAFGALGAFGAYPYYSLPMIWDTSGQDYSDMTSQQMAQAERATAQASDLTAQIEQLREELRQMREQQSPAPAAAPQASAPRDEAQPQTPPTPTTLVFRDGRRSEVENYAIIGNTLWVFSDQRRKKIPIADLDLKATEQINEDRGVDFTIPPSGK
jgi:outer membrane murein-binding lipoprotein Lpp